MRYVKLYAYSEFKNDSFVAQLPIWSGSPVPGGSA